MHSVSLRCYFLRNGSGFCRDLCWCGIFPAADDIGGKAGADGPVDAVHDLAGLADVFFYLLAVLYQQAVIGLKISIQRTVQRDADAAAAVIPAHLDLHAGGQRDEEVAHLLVAPARVQHQLRGA